MCKVVKVDREVATAMMEGFGLGIGLALRAVFEHPPTTAERAAELAKQLHGLAETARAAELDVSATVIETIGDGLTLNLSAMTGH